MVDLGEVRKVEVSEIGPGNWAEAEKVAGEIIGKLHPDSVSEEKRSGVIDYVQSLMRNQMGAEVLPYGSVPLKTYLPDGDIDLTAFGGEKMEETIADDMKSVLEEAEKNGDGEFVVKDVQLIRAEVKIVKCIVQDIVVDISVNQIGGLSTLCFLEQVDNLVGKDHLFKRSIILTKAWCYYESRILGAHHGLIATYALEILVLYILHVFHSRLNGPLSVLHKFLDYFSRFDWDTYCISLNGPVRLSSLPLIVADTPEDSDKDLLLSSEFLSSCVQKYAVTSRNGDNNARGFQIKHLNIIDPMKKTNNLGRSVSKGSFYRIRSAFSYGARKLKSLLLLPKSSITKELQNFFANTRARIETGHRHEVQDSDPSVTCKQPILSFPGQETGSDKSIDLSKHHNETYETSRCQQETVDSVQMSFFAPHLCFAKLRLANERMQDERENSGKSNERETEIPSRSEEGRQDLNVDEKRDSLLNSFSVLTGDYELYLQRLQYGRQCYEHSMNTPSLYCPPLPIATHQSNNQWNGLTQSQFQNNGVSHILQTGFYQDPVFYHMQQHMVIQRAPFGYEELPKPRGTGTYLPNVNHRPRGYRPSSYNRRKNQASSRSSQNSGRTTITSEPNYSHMRNKEASPQLRFPVERNVTVDSSEIFSPFPPRTNGYHMANGFHAQPNGLVEFESDGLGPVAPEQSRQQKPVSSSPRLSSEVQMTLPALSRNQDNRISLKSSYKLKDEDDFPPLCVK